MQDLCNTKALHTSAHAKGPGFCVRRCAGSERIWRRVMQDLQFTEALHVLGLAEPLAPA